jgi:small-conductance mechanosensitive channel
MDVQQYFNLRIMEEFRRNKIEFAYPTQQLYVTNAGDLPRLPLTE